MLSWTAACFVFVRRFAARKQRGWVGAGVATAVAVLALVSWPDMDGVSVRLVLASAIQFGSWRHWRSNCLPGLPLRRADQRTDPDGIVEVNDEHEPDTGADEIPSAHRS